MSEQFTTFVYYHACYLPIYFLQGIQFGLEKVQTMILEGELKEKKANLEKTKNDLFTAATLLKVL